MPNKWWPRPVGRDQARRDLVCMPILAGTKHDLLDPTFSKRVGENEVRAVAARLIRCSICGASACARGQFWPSPADSERWGVDWIAFALCRKHTLAPKQTKQKLLILFDSLLAKHERVDA
jgi:hypothetical protein